MLPFKNHRLFKVLKWARDSEDSTECELQETRTYDEADVIASQFTAEWAFKENPDDHPDLHSVMLDIDVPAYLFPSTTDGHSHLFVEVLTTWESYERLLDALADCGVIQRGYAEASKARKFTALRLPWIAK